MQQPSRARHQAQHPLALFAVAAMLAILIALPLAAEPAPTVEDIEALNLAADIDGVLGALEQLAEHGKTEAAGPSHRTTYLEGLARYRAATLMMSDLERGQQARVVLEEAQQGLEALLESLPPGSSQSAEVQSLLAAVMGLRIGVQPAMGMRLGPASQRLLAQAEKTAPQNPRVHLQLGVSYFNTPKMWGGSLDKAEVSLRKAVEIFAQQHGQEKTSHNWPHWGYLDALAWLGQTLAKKGDVEQARAAYQQALAIEPEMGWIKYQLLPGLDRSSQ